MPVAVPVKTTTDRASLNKDKQGRNGYDIEIGHNQSPKTRFLFQPLLSHSLVHPGARSTPKDSTVGGIMALNGTSSNGAERMLPGIVPLATLPGEPYTPLQWDWDIEHEDRKREAKAEAALDGVPPFQVDRRVLKDIVREKTHCEVGRITFLSSGTFHKAYLVTLVDTRQLVARVARRFMPRLKTQSEVATMQYLREKTSLPLPDVYFYDANPYNRLGGEYILMSKAPGIPLSAVYHSMPNEQLKILFRNVASLIIPLFAHRFSHIGSLYFNSQPAASPALTSSVATPTATEIQLKNFPFLAARLTSVSTPNVAHAAARDPPRTPSTSAYVGPIVSWPFFGSGRGDLSHPAEIDRGPWSTTRSYLEACVAREIAGVKLENEGKSAPHRLHLDPDEIRSSRHHHLDAVPDDQSDDSDEWDAQESEEEWDGPGDAMYRDYRRMQRSTFLIAHIMRREQAARREMVRWMRVMERLGAMGENNHHHHQHHASGGGGGGGGGGGEVFGLDCHDLNLDNVFVDERDNTKITCIIDWESTTTRPLWACAHLPAFVQTSPFTSRLFRDVVARIALSSSRQTSSPDDLATIAKEWLHYEALGARLRIAHRCVEWDGWEEGLVDSILGPEETEDEWFKDVESTVDGSSEAPSAVSYANHHNRHHHHHDHNHNHNNGACIESDASASASGSEPSSGVLFVAALKHRKQAGHLPLKKAREREQTLTTTGDICGGLGGELGRRLEAWLSVKGNGRRVMEEEQEEYDAGPE